MKKLHIPMGFLGFAILAAVLWSTPAMPVVAQPGDSSYAPQAPPESYQAALRSNLKIVRDWIDMGDFASANQSQRLVAALAQLYALRSNDPKHKEATAALLVACDKVSTALRAKNVEASKKALKDCEDAVAALAKTPPGEKAVHKNFRAFANTQTWMMLMDCSIIDAKETKSADEFQQLALAVAEQANVTQFLRNDAKWRKFSEDTRAVALKAAETAKKDGLDAGRTELKKINQTCEACHQGYKR